MALNQRCVLVAMLLAMVGVGTAWGQSGRIRGRVFVDTAYSPLSDVEVLLPDLSRTATTDRKGEFRFVDVPAGTYRIQARKIGYAAHDGTVEVGGSAEVQVGIVLPRLTQLDAAVVVGNAYLPLSFLENRAAGLGHFIDRRELEQQGNRKLSDILALIPGLGIVQGRNNQGWIMSKRVVPRLNPARSNMPGTDMYFPEAFEKAQGLVAGCYARVYLDNALLNPSTPALPVNLNDFVSQQIEAIEYYAGPSQTPLKYSRLNTTCGVLVIHTRRSP